MATFYNSKWNILPGAFRADPIISKRLLIQVESAGLEYTSANYTQRVVINGSQVLSATAPRSYRVTRISQNPTTGVFTYQSSNGYDVYGLTSEATALNTYLTTFNAGDLLILNTWDEPLNNRSTFQTELINNFGAQLQNSSIWEFRCAYLLVAIKGKGVLYEDIRGRTSSTSITATLWLD